MSKSKPTENEKLFYGNKFTADSANKLTNSISQQVLGTRWQIIIGIIELVAYDGHLTAVIPFNLRTSEARKLEKIGYTVAGNTVDWDIDLFSTEDMKDAFK